MAKTPTKAVRDKDGRKKTVPTNIAPPSHDEIVKAQLSDALGDRRYDAIGSESRPREYRAAGDKVFGTDRTPAYEDRYGTMPVRQAEYNKPPQADVTQKQTARMKGASAEKYRPNVDEVVQ